MADNDVLTEESILQLVNELINVEAAAREAADSQEAINRQASDDMLGQLINQEVDERKAALSALQTAVNQSITRIDGNVTQLQILFNQRYDSTIATISNLNASFDEKVALLDGLRQTVLANQASVAILQGDESTVGSVANALFDAKAYTDSKVSELLGGAPELLDTLKELADSIGNDGNFIATINTSISNEASTRQQQVIELQEAIAALGGAVGNELSQAIDSLESSISNEASARIAGDAATLEAANQYSDANKNQVLSLLSNYLLKRQKIIITSQHISQGYVELPHVGIVLGSLDAYIDRLGIFEDEDFELSEVDGKTRLTFINSFSEGGDEEIEQGAELRVKYWIV